MHALRRLSSLKNAATVLARAAPPPPVRCCRLSTGAPSRPPPPQTPKDTSKMRVSSGSLGYQPDARPDAETVKRLAENAKLQQAVWNVWVPEAGIRFGDRCVSLPPSIAPPSRAAREGDIAQSAIEGEVAHAAALWSSALQGDVAHCSRALPRRELMPAADSPPLTARRVSRRRKFWILLSIVGTLHMINTYRFANPHPHPHPNPN